MNILAIGNSFSQDATRYLHGIARSMGKKWNTANLYIGGCSIDRHRSAACGKICIMIRPPCFPPHFCARIYI